MKDLIIHADAETELEEAIAWYEDKQKGLGLRLEQEVRKLLNSIQAAPKLGSPWGRRFRVRKVHDFPYVIYYRETSTMIWISAVAHERRRPGYWGSRKPD